MMIIQSIAFVRKEAAKRIGMDAHDIKSAAQLWRDTRLDRYSDFAILVGYADNPPRAYRGFRNTYRRYKADDRFVEVRVADS